MSRKFVAGYQHPNLTIPIRPVASVNLWVPCSLLQGELFFASLRRQLLGLASPPPQASLRSLPLKARFARSAAGSRRPLRQHKPPEPPPQSSLRSLSWIPCCLQQGHLLGGMAPIRKKSRGITSLRHFPPES